MANKSQIFLFVGYHARRRNAISQLEKRYDLTETYKFDQDTPLDYVLEKLQTFSCFEARRLIVLNDWPAASSRTVAINKLAKAFEKLPDDVVVVLNNLQTRAKAFTSAVKKKGESHYWPEKINQYDAVEYVIDTINDKAKAIDREDSQLLINSICPSYGRTREVDMDKLVLLVRKLLDYVGSRKNIKKDDVISVSIDHTDFIIWQLMGAIDEGNYGEAMRLVHKADAESSTTSGRFEVLYGILRMLLWRYRLLLLIKETAHWHGSDNVVDRLLQLPKIKKKEKTFGRFSSFVTEIGEDNTPKPIYSKKAVEFAMLGYGAKAAISYYDRTDLILIFKAINKAFLKIRSTPSIGECLLCMDSVLLTACRKMPEAKTGFMREEYIY